MKGAIEIEYMPIMCHKCNKTLVNAFARKNDSDTLREFFVYCYDCGRSKGLSRVGTNEER